MFGKTIEAIEIGGSGTVAVYGDDESATGETVKASSPVFPVEANKWVFLTDFGRWFITSAEV